MLSSIAKLFRRIFKKGRNQGEMEFLIQNGLRVGEGFRNHSSCLFDALLPWLITVGNNVCVSANVKILAHDTSTEYVNGHSKIGIVEIGYDVYIGYGATIMCNVRIGNGAIIGAGSIVTKDVPAGTVYAGNPARYICDVEEYKRKHTNMLNEVPVYEGPCRKWWEASLEEKEAMRIALKDTHGYMK